MKKKALAVVVLFISFADISAKECRWKQVYRFPAKGQEGQTLKLAPENFRPYGPEVVKEIEGYISDGVIAAAGLTIHQDCNGKVRIDVENFDSQPYRVDSGTSPRVVASQQALPKRMIAARISSGGAATALGFVHPALGLLGFVLDPFLSWAFGGRHVEPQVTNVALAPAAPQVASAAVPRPRTKERLRDYMEQILKRQGRQGRQDLIAAW